MGAGSAPRSEAWLTPPDTCAGGERLALPGLHRARLRWSIVGAVASGLAWQGAAIAAPLLVQRAIDAARRREQEHARLVVRRDRRSWARSRPSRAGSGTIRDPQPRARRRRGARRDLPPRARARRPLPRPGRRRRADLARLERRRARRRAFDSIGHTVGYMLTVVGIAVVLLVIDWQLGLAVLAAPAAPQRRLRPLLGALRRRGRR